MRRSLGPEVGVGRWVALRAEPLEGRMAARCWPEGVDVPAVSKTSNFRVWHLDNVVVALLNIWNRQRL